VVLYGPFDGDRGLARKQMVALHRRRRSMSGTGIGREAAASLSMLGIHRTVLIE
jgi:hypothetical protein